MSEDKTGGAQTGRLSARAALPGYRPVTAEEWAEAKRRESPAEELGHPCGAFDPEMCFCAGVCSCHWRKLEEAKA